MALRIGSGVGLEPLQERVDALELQAIRGVRFTDADVAFLRDLYGTLATGGRLVLVLGQTGKLMQHYLERSGTDYRLSRGLFDTRPVRTEMARLRSKLEAQACTAPVPLVSPEFALSGRGDPLDARFAFNTGTLRLQAQRSSTGRCVLHWRAEAPWVWPSYEILQRKNGKYHANNVPMPNLRVLISRNAPMLHLDDGLGQHLVSLGLAKPFLAYAEWEEELAMTAR